MEVSVGKSSINGPFCIATFDYRRVIHFFSVTHDIFPRHGSSWVLDPWSMVATMASSHEYKWDKPQELEDLLQIPFRVTWTKHHWHQFVRQIIRNHESHKIYKGPKQSIGSLLWYADQKYPKTSGSLSNSFTKDAATRWALGFVSTWSGAMAAQSRTQNEEIQSQTSFSRLLILSDLATRGMM